MDWSESVREDLAAMRRLAEQGGRLTMPGGPYYIIWGVLVGLGFLATYLIALRVIPLPGWTIGAAWAVLTIAGWAISIQRGRKEQSNPDAVRMTNRIVSSVWVMTGAAMGLFFFANLASGAFPGMIMGIIAPFFIGIAFGLIAMLCRVTWMFVPTVAWFALGILPMFVTFDATMAIVFGVVFVLIMVGTGLKLIAMERQAHG